MHKITLVTPVRCIELLDHIIINTKDYIGFKDEGLMNTIALSTKYVPPYVLIEKIRAEEKKIRMEMEENHHKELQKKENSYKENLKKQSQSIRTEFKEKFKEKDLSHKKELKAKDQSLVENLLANQITNCAYPAINP